MSYQITRQGTYELYRMEGDERILVLDDDHFALEPGYFTISEGSQGELVARRPSDLSAGSLVRSGGYRIIEFEEESQFQDIPYLFLEHDDKYDEIFLSEGLPTTIGERRRYIYTDHSIATAELDAYLDTGPVAGDEDEVADKEPPVEDYFDLTAGDLAQKIRQMQPAELRRLEEYEKRHKNRNTVLNTIRNRFH